MRKLLFAILLLWSGSSYAQKNTLLEPTFWQKKPDVATVKAEIEKGADPAQFNNLPLMLKHRMKPSNIY
jgi:hypothetical protein